MNRRLSAVRFVLLAALVTPFLVGGAGRVRAAGDDAAWGRFSEIPGVREFSGFLIARPLQPDVLAERGMGAAEIDAVREAARADLERYNVLERIPQTDETIFAVPAGSSERREASRLMATGRFQYVVPDWIVYPVACPDDPLFADQWHHQANRMQSCDGWGIDTGNPSVGIGICDTGVRTTHEDLLLHRLEGYNAVDRLWESQGGHIDPVHPHGTETTGSAAANGNNAVGVSGVGWDLSHRMLRVTNSPDGTAWLSDLQDAARTSIEAGDRVASVSYSGADSPSNLTTATYIKSIGGLLVWAAGNDSRYLDLNDRDADDMIVVGATDEGDGPAWFTAYGPFVDLVAPGVNILTTDASGDASYSWVSGTSFSTPLTAGLCGLIWSADSTLTPNQVEDLLKQGVDDLGAGGVDDTYGYGRINVYGSLSLVGGGGSPPVADFSGSPTSGAAPLDVAFTDLSTGSPATWSWDFGDGGTSTVQHPTHTYADTGLYTVTLTVTNGYGSDTRIRTDYITVGSLPVADFSGSPTSGAAPLDVAFTDLSTGSPATWSWDFGDGGTSTVQHPTHTYADTGLYTVTLTVTNGYGSDTRIRTDYITVGFVPDIDDGGFRARRYGNGP